MSHDISSSLTTEVISWKQQTVRWTSLFWLAYPHKMNGEHHNIFFILVIILIINTYQLCSHYFLGICCLGGEMDWLRWLYLFLFVISSLFILYFWGTRILVLTGSYRVSRRVKKKNILSGLLNVVWTLVHSPLRLALLNVNWKSTGK